MFKKKIFYPAGKPLLTSGLIILILGLLYFLLPWISQQISPTNPIIILSKNNAYIVCLQKETFNPLKNSLHQWQQLNNTQIINLVTFNNYPPEDCNIIVTTSKISDLSRILYNFSGVWATHKDSPILTNLSTKNLLTLKTNGQIINLLPLAIEGIPSTKLTFKQLPVLDKKNLYILPAEKINAYLNNLKLINIEEKSILNKNKQALISEQIYITNNLVNPSIIPLRGYLQTSLATETFNTDSLDKIIITGRSQIGAKGDFIYQPAMSKQQIKLLKTADLAILTNQTALSNRCSQHLNAIYLCGRPTSWQKFAPYFEIVFQYGKSSLHYDYDDFINTLQIYTKQTGQVIGATTNKNYSPASFKTSNYDYSIYGFNLGVRPQFCYSSQTNLPVGLICANSINHLKQQIIQTENKINIIYIYSPNQLDINSLQTLLNGSTQAVILLTPNNKKTKVTWFTINGVTKVILQPRDYWIINSLTDLKKIENIHLSELYFYKNKLFSIKE